MTARRRVPDWIPPSDGEVAVLAEQLGGAIKRGEELLGEGYDNGKWSGWVVETKHLITAALGSEPWGREFEEATGGASFEVVGQYEGYGDEDGGMLEARNEDVHAKLGVARAALRVIAQNLERSGAKPRDSGLRERDFAFMQPGVLQDIARRDYNELRAVAGATTKAAAVLAGSVIEAALQDALARVGLQREKTEKMRFVDLINAALGAGVIKPRTEKAAHAVRDIRNFAHPAVELSEGPIRSVDAKTAISLMNQVLEDLVATN